jgi:hypothetical protein
LKEKPPDTKAGSRFNPKPCRACHAISKAKCIFCGQQWNVKKMDMTAWEIVIFDGWVEKIEYLKSTYNKLVVCKMRTTGCESLDKEILLHIGDWRTLI